LDEERRKSGISAKSGDSEEEFYSAEDDVEDETAQEKKLRLAKVYLEEIEKEERNRRENDEVDTDVMASRLKDDVLEAEGRLRKEVADQVEPDLENITVLTCSKYLKR
jgi:ribosomal RNA-processing protein 9